MLKETRPTTSIHYIRAWDNELTSRGEKHTSCITLIWNLLKHKIIIIFITVYWCWKKHLIRVTCEHRNIQRYSFIMEMDERFCKADFDLLKSPKMTRKGKSIMNNKTSGESLFVKLELRLHRKHLWVGHIRLNLCIGSPSLPV